MALSMRGTGVFRSRDSAKTWSLLPAFPELPNARLDCGLIIPGKWLVGTAPGGLWRSLDEGESWNVVAGTEHLSIFAITAWQKDQKILAAGTNDGVWMSNDGGGKWRRISPRINADLSVIVSVAFDPQKAGTLYAGTPHLPWKTTNGGTSWTRAHIGMFDDSDIFSIAVDPTRQGRVFASACSGIYCSLNHGAAWRRVQGIPGTNRRTYVVAQAPHNPDLLFAGTSAGMWNSEDGGLNWKKLNELVATSIAFHPSDKGRFYISTERHGLLGTLNDGKSFEPVNEGFVSRSLLSAESDEESLYAISQYEGSFAKSSAGNWQPAPFRSELIAQTPAGDWFETAINPFDKNEWLRASRLGLTKSSDGGKTWRTLQSEWIRSVQFHPKLKGLCFALRQQRVFWSPDAGENWYWFPAKEELHLTFEKLRLSRAFPDLLFAVSPHRGIYVQTLLQIR